MLRGAKAIAKLIAALALLAGAGAALLFAGALPAGAQTVTDYDANDNNLIDIASIAQLDAIRHDPDGNGDATHADYVAAFPNRDTNTTTRMGCPTGTCTGYELTANLTYATTTGWTPIANLDTTLEGNGHTITGIHINVATGNAGMINRLDNNAVIRNLGLIDFNVTSTAAGATRNGILAADNSNHASPADIIHTYVSGGSIHVSSNTANATVGGLVGSFGGALRASYATAAVTITGASTARYAGGLFGRCLRCTIYNAYAAGPVSSPDAALAHIGGLVGNFDHSASRVNFSAYCDTEAGGQPCVGSRTGANAPADTPVTGYTTAEMQAPTGYYGIYLNWNIDGDGNLHPDWLWDFGADDDYPALNTPAERTAATPADTDYDSDDNGLIEISNLNQLNALRWDPEGDGQPIGRHLNAYGTAFGGRDPATTTRMGCPSGNCTGYELAASLTFPAAGPHTPWTPVIEDVAIPPDPYNATFDGQGRAIINLRVEHHGNNAGLFDTLGGSSTVRDLLLVNPRVTNTDDGNVGSLAGRLLAGGGVRRVGVLGGRIAAAQTAGFSRAGGLLGQVPTGAAVSDSYSSAEIAVNLPAVTFAGGLLGEHRGSLNNSFAYGRIAAVNDPSIGGLIGTTGHSTTSTASYCDTEASGQPDCIGARAGDYWPTSTSPILEKTTAELQTPTGYTGIYEAWAPADTSTQRWDFGGSGDYPRLWFAPRGAADSPPPGGPRYAQPPQDTPYNPAADHPEIYQNPRYEMAADCDVQTNADGEPESSQITIDLGRYRGAVILHLAIWNGEYFTSYESQDIPMPDFQRNGQTATVRVTTDPTQTRFLLDSVSPTTNLVLGYADCHTDDPGAAESEPAESAATSTEETPPPPKVYANDRYEMTASCEVQRNADGEPESSLISFDLGSYEGAVILHLSLWNGEYYASYESQDVDMPPFERDGQSATVRVATDPARTRFLLNSVAPTMNLVLGYADCHTAG